MAEPNLRFKRDDGTSFPAWEEVRFCDIFTEIVRKTSDTQTYPLFSLTIENGVTAKTDRYERSHLLKKDEDNYKIVPPRAFVYNPMNLRFGALAASHENREVSVSQYYNVFVLNDETTLSFWENYLVSDAMLQYYFSIATGSLIEKLRVHFSSFVNITKPVPCAEEQQRIADFLSSVDEVIAASEEEVANLETQKKAAMKKVFSQEVRFKRADGRDFPEWEEQTLGNLAEFSKGQGYTKSDLSVAGSPIILYGRLYTKYQTVISEVDTFTEMKPRSVLSRKGDVIVPASGETAEDISVASVVNVDGIILGGDINIIHPCDTILPDYLAYALTFGTPHQEMAKRAQGKSIVHLHNDDLKSAVIVYPCCEEQSLISDFLSDFDEAIAAAKKELKLWKELKKGLLQQMFI